MDKPGPESAIAILTKHRDAIELLCRQYGVTRLRLFGSAVRNDWDPATSDFDFLAEFGPPPAGINLFKQLFGLVADLEELLGRSVDVVDWNATKKPLFRRLAESEAREWYAA